MLLTAGGGERRGEGSGGKGGMATSGERRGLAAVEEMRGGGGLRCQWREEHGGSEGEYERGRRSERGGRIRVCSWGGG
jgi:hypothetical protein